LGALILSCAAAAKVRLGKSSGDESGVVKTSCQHLVAKPVTTNHKSKFWENHEYIVSSKFA